MKLVNIGCGSNYHKDWINLDLYRSKFVKYHNIKKPLPFTNSSVDVIYHSHVLEHLNKQEANNFIEECFRVLKSDGIMRVVVPDLEQICREYLNNLENGFSSNNVEIIAKYNWNKIEIFDQMIRQKSGGEMIETIINKKINFNYVVQRNGDELKPLFVSTSNNKLLIKNYLKLFLRKFRKSPQKSGEAHKWMYDKLDLKILLKSHGFKNFKVIKYNESIIMNWSSHALDKSKNGDFARKPDSLFIEVVK